MHCFFFYFSCGTVSATFFNFSAMLIYKYNAEILNIINHRSFFLNLAINFKSLKHHPRRLRAYFKADLEFFRWQILWFEKKKFSSLWNLNFKNNFCAVVLTISSFIVNHLLSSGVEDCLIELEELKKLDLSRKRAFSSHTVETKKLWNIKTSADF